MQRLPDKVDLAAAAVVQPGENRQQRRFTGTGLANQRDGFSAFDNEFNSGKDGKLVFPLTDGLLKMMNFNMFSAGICPSCF
jgi:acyl-CoA thioesterase-1